MLATTTMQKNVLTTEQVVSRSIRTIFELHPLLYDDADVRALCHKQQTEKVEYTKQPVGCSDAIALRVVKVDNIPFWWCERHRHAVDDCGHLLHFRDKTKDEPRLPRRKAERFIYVQGGACILDRIWGLLPKAGRN